MSDMDDTQLKVTGEIRYLVDRVRWDGLYATGELSSGNGKRLSDETVAAVK